MQSNKTPAIFNSIISIAYFVIHFYFQRPTVLISMEIEIYLTLFFRSNNFHVEDTLYKKVNHSRQATFSDWSWKLNHWTTWLMNGEKHSTNCVNSLIYYIYEWQKDFGWLRFGVRIAKRCRTEIYNSKKLFVNLWRN